MKELTTTSIVPQEDFFSPSPERFSINLYALADGEPWRIDGLQFCLIEQERLGFIRILSMTDNAAEIDVHDQECVGFFRDMTMGNA